ncbi:MAG: FkbM family methyltransferase [Candidatus Bathyarchaeia archaeon]
MEIYSEREYFLLDSHIPKRGDIIVDCGAYVGLYSIISSKLSGNDGKVVSIEPVPDTFELLKKNIQLNKLKNVRLFNIALADREGEAELFIPKFSAAGSTFFLNHLHVQEVKEYTKVRVRVVSFDEFTRNELKDIDHINIMKIDTEGAELPILHGMQNSLKRKFIDKLIIEIHKAVTSPKQVISFLIDNKYIIDAYFDINDLKGILYASASG